MCCDPQNRVAVGEKVMFRTKAENTFGAGGALAVPIVRNTSDRRTSNTVPWNHKESLGAQQGLELARHTTGTQ